ncbi:MAG: SRPBCC family protein [Planctomycetes bacterium]|nr:SRPBCC family protein [Planctomycetota bacterium]MCB9903841.1 SRPBCC family protein [Planctomycetota bacterium]
MEIEETIEIARPVEEVQAYLADPSKLPDWIGGLVDFELQPDGSFRHVMSVSGRKLPVVGRIECRVPGELVVMRVEGELGVLEAEHHLRAIEGGTRLLHRSIARIDNMLMRMVLSGMKDAARRRLRDDLERLRGRLER